MKDWRKKIIDDIYAKYLEKAHESTVQMMLMTVLPYVYLSEAVGEAIDKAIVKARKEERQRWEKALPEKKDYKAETIFVEDCQTYMMGFNTCLKQIKKNLNINL